MRKHLSVHSADYEDSIKQRISDLLIDIYGKDEGVLHFNYITEKTEGYLKSRSEEQLNHAAAYDPDDLYKDLSGKVFAICYPDSAKKKGESTLKTLQSALKKYFPGINGIHILPERLMSHQDVIEQDFYHFAGKKKSSEYINVLFKHGILDKNNFVSDLYPEKISLVADDLPDQVLAILKDAYNYHFNDGGFSQKTREKLDPRFGSAEDLKALSKEYAVMLDYVINHLDIDNPALESYRSGGLDPGCFLIITPQEYREYIENGMLEKTFRPRPFPLFTGLRKYPDKKKSSIEEQVRNLESLFLAENIKPLPGCVAAAASIYYKIQNDQGLTLEDKRVFDTFFLWLDDQKIKKDSLFFESGIHHGFYKFTGEAGNSLNCFLELLGFGEPEIQCFLKYEEKVFGEVFYIYTTFSESQCDLNPVSTAGFRMIIDDLFFILSSGSLTMLRMDAIKYLWKEVGKVNFNMEEGDHLIEVIKLTMRLAAPEVVPLDEVNSSDPQVYNMGSGGGFYYLFGPVNAVSIAFNEQNIGPLSNVYSSMRELCSPDLLLFVMLSTHDGRSVQGLGVPDLAGHVSIEQFYDYKKVIEEQGGIPKYRSVTPGVISKDLYRKTLMEADLLVYKEELKVIFHKDEYESVLIDEQYQDKDILLKTVSGITGKTSDELNAVPAFNFMLNWICDGKTVYELCASTRSSLSILPKNSLQLEAKRMALAQLYVLTMGQVVPAIYFNDLFAMENDKDGYNLSGKPRDLNRHKLDLTEGKDPFKKDGFLKHYLPLLNKMITLRSEDKAFYPGSSQFEYIQLTKHVFVNHPFADSDMSLIIGNISDSVQDIQLDLSTLEHSSSGDSVFIDILNDTEISAGTILELSLSPFSAVYLKEKH